MDTDVTPRRVRVVVADDTEDMRLLLRMAIVLRSDLELVGEAADGEQAIQLTAALRPDLLVLDVDMPVLDGLSALPRLREVAPETRVVILSASPASLHGRTALGAGAVAYVEKSTSVTTLIDEILRGADLIDRMMASLAVSVNASLTRDRASASEARRFMARTLGTWDLGAWDQDVGLVDTILLLMTELVTNVLVHTEGAPAVRVSLLPDRVHVEVFDPDPTPVRVGRADVDATSGRGLHLVAALASTWGSVRVGAGKVVWFDVARRS